MKKQIKLLSLILLFFQISVLAEETIDLTLIPPTTVTNKVDLDVRVGVKNNGDSSKYMTIMVYIHKETKKNLLYKSTLKVGANKSGVIKFNLPTYDKVGKNKIIAVVEGKNFSKKITKQIEVIESNVRSVRTIDGAWLGIYHWSETEGKHWNNDIKLMTESQWKEMVQAMHKVNMDIVVIQEVFRNQHYVGKHNQSVENYDGKAFYPSKLYNSRAQVAAHDPIEAILSEADKLGMHIFLGVGAFAWFDFTKESLEWHKVVAKELWEMYGHHSSFYGFYVSEESGGGLDNGEKDEATRLKRKTDIVVFFKEFKEYCHQFAPSKPIMMATNSMNVPVGLDTYPQLLSYLDILCPFGFARMPKNDLTGMEAANLLQKLCDDAGSHLWFDLEAFLFNKDMSLYPRPMKEILNDLNLFDNFEKILCYQFPGVFNDPEMSIRVGELRTIELFNDYLAYLKGLKVKKSNDK